MSTTTAPGTSAGWRTQFPSLPNGQLGWHRFAPQTVATADDRSDTSAAWSAWARHLAKREHPRSLAKLLSSRAHPLAWALGGGAHPDPRVASGPGMGAALALLARLDRWQRRKRPDQLAPPDLLRRWRVEATGASAGVPYAIECLAWTHALPKLARWLPADCWWESLEHLVAAAEHAAGAGAPGHPLARQLLAGELPLTLAYLFPEIGPCRQLASPAREVLAAGVEEVLDGEGLPRCGQLHLLRPLLACWTRWRAIDEELQEAPWPVVLEVQYDRLLRQALRLTRWDGAEVFAPVSWAASRARADAEMFAAALRWAPHERPVADLVLRRRSRSGRKPARPAKLPAAAVHSQRAELALLTPCWSPAVERLAVAYGGRRLVAELACGRDVIWSGPWNPDVRLDGMPLEPESAWQPVCWVSDADVDYLELEMSLAGAVRIQRHLLLARVDRFLLVADAVLAGRPGQIVYQATLPLAPGIRFEAASETREGYLVARARRALVLPLALPEWRTDLRGGMLSAAVGGLELRQAAEEGRALFAPLFIDLHPRRLGQPATWRKLTVAESRVIQPPDMAVGYRVQVGQRQWLLYRALSGRGSRTLLGHNLAGAFLVGRFSRSGRVEPLLEIE